MMRPRDTKLMVVSPSMRNALIFSDNGTRYDFQFGRDRPYQNSPAKIKALPRLVLLLLTIQKRKESLTPKEEFKYSLVYPPLLR